MNYLVLGAGPAGVIAAETLRRADADGAITLVGDEPEPPYSRMAIPYYMAEHVADEGTHLRHRDGHFERLGIALRKGRASALAPGAKTVTLAGGETLAYDRLLIATGSHPLRPPIPGMDLAGVENCWTLEDARRIVAATRPGARVVLMGAGFIGCIILEALAARKVELTVVEMAERMLARMMDDIGGDMIARWCAARGVRVLTGTRVTGIERTADGLSLALSNGEALAADLVVSATGVAPNLDFLEGSGIETDAGILVDAHLATSAADVYAAGDVAQGPTFPSGRKEVHAIQPTASEHGRIAARNMAGHATRYRGSLAMNVLNTVGLISSSFGAWDGVEGGDRAHVADRDRFKYLRVEFAGDRLVGALAIGLTEHVGVIRGLIQTGVRLGRWKEALMRDPHLVMSAYLAGTQAGA